MQLKRLASFLVVLAGLVTASVSAFAADPENTMIITLKDGDVTIELRPDLAPKHVAQIKKLVREGAYDNVAFHRVIDGFMAQTGDVKFGNMKKGFNPEAVGTGGSDLPDLPAEFSQTEHYQRGVVGMARSQDPNSANSQFFIMFADGASLNGKYTVIGEVVSGMDVVDKIKRGEPVADPDKMVKVQVASDVK
jgi:cyclophilin family peptidyl-prolyl cis-trans isomerase